MCLHSSKLVSSAGKVVFNRMWFFSVRQRGCGLVGGWGVCERMFTFTINKTETQKMADAAIL